MRDIRQQNIMLGPAVHTIASRAEQRTLESDLSGAPERRGSGDVGVADTQPPLYYAILSVPYVLGSGGTIVERLQLMRLFSALMAAVTALFVFLFLREALPGTPWAWTVGGLGVALAPLLGFMSGAVNPDAMLFAVSAALFFCLALAFRRGLTRRVGIICGVVIAIGFMTKLNFVGLAPGALLGLVLLARREARSSGREVYLRTLAPALLIALSPVLLYGLVNAVSGKPMVGALSGGLGDLIEGRTSLPHEMSYIWQFYLPRLPWMNNYFGEIVTTRQFWFDGMVGIYGWADTVFPGWAYDAAIVPVALIGVLCCRGLALGYSVLRHRLAELLVYATMSLGLLLLVGAASHVTASTSPAQFSEARYMLPMLALWGAVLAFAARGAGRRWGPAVGALIVVLVLTHDIVSQMQVMARYYG